MQFLQLLKIQLFILIQTISGFAALFGLFSDRPGPATLPADLNGQLISALYDYKPSINDTGRQIITL